MLERIVELMMERNQRDANQSEAATPVAAVSETAGFR